MSHTINSYFKQLHTVDQNLPTDWWPHVNFLKDGSDRQYRDGIISMTFLATAGFLDRNYHYSNLLLCWISTDPICCSKISPSKAIKPVMYPLWILLNIMSHAPMGRFQLELIYYFTYFSTVVPSNICVFLSCRPSVVNTTFSTGLVGVEVSSQDLLKMLY